MEVLKSASPDRDWYRPSCARADWDFGKIAFSFGQRRNGSVGIASSNRPVEVVGAAWMDRQQSHVLCGACLSIDTVENLLSKQSEIFPDILVSFGNEKSPARRQSQIWQRKRRPLLEMFAVQRDEEVGIL